MCGVGAIGVGAWERAVRATARFVPGLVLRFGGIAVQMWAGVYVWSHVPGVGRNVLLSLILTCSAPLGVVSGAGLYWEWARWREGRPWLGGS